MIQFLKKKKYEGDTVFERCLVHHKPFQVLRLCLAWWYTYLLSWHWDKSLWQAQSTLCTSVRPCLKNKRVLGLWVAGRQINCLAYENQKVPSQHWKVTVNKRCLFLHFHLIFFFSLTVGGCRHLAGVLYLIEPWATGNGVIEHRVGGVFLWEER